MEKRKAYIEQMTSYLNDRIRELNKVKEDLAAEQKWIKISNARISELAAKEKLIKLEDVRSCIDAEKKRLEGESGSKTNSLKDLEAQTKALQDTIKNIKTSMDATTQAS